MLTILGDAHGQIDKVLKVTEKEKNIVQIGDWGYNQAFDILKWLSPSEYKVLYGNHDAYNRFDDFVKSGHNLGHFGSTTFGDVDFFFIRGGCSIDQKERTLGFDFFLEEELNEEQQNECKVLFEKEKPEIVLSHEGPAPIIEELFPNRSLLRAFGYDDNWTSKTQELLRELWHMSLLGDYAPKVWIFGHMHSFRDKVIDGTRFICLPELGMCRIRSTNEIEFANIKRGG